MFFIVLYAEINENYDKILLFELVFFEVRYNNLYKMNFTDSQKEKIKEAVKELESKTAGEVVPFFVRKSNHYKEASWFSALLFGFFMIAGAGALHFIYSELSVVLLLLLFAVALVIGWFLPVLLPVSIRFLLSDSYLDQIVFQRAIEAFVTEEVFDTQDRIGVLIFISDLERKVVVLADKEINKTVEKDKWDDLVLLVTSGIKKGEPAEGLIDAIKSCERILLDHDFVNRVKPKNEISDDLRIG